MRPASRSLPTKFAETITKYKISYFALENCMDG
jgi:hypothetical protein